VSHNPRQLAFLTLRAVDRGVFADAALDQVLRQSRSGKSTDAPTLSSLDRGLLTELLYGCVRRQRSLDALIDQLGKKPADQQPPDLRLILHLGLYQLRYLNQIPAAAAVNTSVELAKQNGFTGLAAVVNGLLRQYARLAESEMDPLQLPQEIVPRLGVLHSYPDWIVAVWLEQFGRSQTDTLCEWLNQPPWIDLRVNPLRASLETVEDALQAAGIAVGRMPHLPQALRLLQPVGAINQLPGFEQGWWMVQDCSAQLVGYLVDPQPGNVIVDACAAPGGKTMHLAELMRDDGTIWACDRTAARLRKLEQNRDRLGLQSIHPLVGDSRQMPQWVGHCDRVLLDVPCSGLGTLHRHADARWRQTPDSVKELAALQQELLEQAATWIKPDGWLVYATCTLHPWENEQQIQHFLERHPDWAIAPPTPDSPPAHFATPEGWVKVLPHQHQMDGFFMVRLRKNVSSEKFVTDRG